MLLFLAAAGEVATAQDLCSDYLSRSNCINKRREVHTGIDFGGVAGTEVISATYGTVLRRTFNECAGAGLVVQADFTEWHDLVNGPVHAHYAHVEPHPDIQPGRALKPGDPIGRTIPLRRTKCHGSREHVHLELRIRDSSQRHLNPHSYWVDGPGKVTCFRDGMAVPAGRIVAPIRCSP
jgi:murein DD-endopeptidase MepM/ murein hydrolase activator NlpD